MSKKNLFLSVLILFLAIVSFPGPDKNSVYAAEYSCPSGSKINTNENIKIYQSEGQNVAYDGLVPCGKCSLVGVTVDSDGKYLSGGTPVDFPCRLCHLFILIKGIVDFILFKIIPLIAVLLLSVGGVMFIVSRGGNSSQLTQAKSMMTAVVVGLVIIFSAWIIVNTIFVIPGFINTNFGWDLTKWFEINCPISLPKTAVSTPT